MTVEKPITTSHIWIVNGIDSNVDMYVNYAAEAAITDVKALSIGPIFTVDGTLARPYQVYTFEFRLKDDVDGQVLAAASVQLEEGKSFAGVLQQLPSGDYQFSIYENDFAPTGNTRMTVRHNARAETLRWQIAPRAGENPEIPKDMREGELQPGEWQSAKEVIENTYVFEVLENGQIVARDNDLELEHEKFLAIYLVGDPQATTDPLALKQHVLVQEYQVPALSQAGPAEVTAPTPPDSASDDNAAVQFDCPAVEVWQTNATTVEVSAVDPDGVVHNLSIDRVDPDLGSIQIPDGGVTISTAVGEPATAQVSIDSDVPGGDYMIRIVSNRGTIAQQAFCTLNLTVKPITVQRLQDQVSAFEASGDINGNFASKLQSILDEVAQHLTDGKTSKACADLTKFQDKVGNQAGARITTAAADDLTLESDAMKTDLGCG